MKVNLVVSAPGPNQGRSIPITGTKFLIGRDPSCQLRPASQAISKIHCAILIHDGVVSIEDFSSTNGTLVNGTAVQGKQAITSGDELKAGPLEFKIEIVPSVAVNDPTPVPQQLKKPSSATLPKPKTAPPSSTAVKPAVKEPIVPKPSTKSPSTETKALSFPSSETLTSTEADDAAAMLLSMDDDAPSGEVPVVPEGSTIMEIPTVDAAGRVIVPKKPEKPENVESSSAANDLLKKYFRRTS
jgi:predicted component of type VI protein secretion system